jgi:hypothetical protein
MSVHRGGEVVMAVRLDDEVFGGSHRRVLLLHHGDAMVGTMVGSGHHGHGGLGLGGGREQGGLCGGKKREMARVRLA